MAKQSDRLTSLFQRMSKEAAGRKASGKTSKNRKTEKSIGEDIDFNFIQAQKLAELLLVKQSMEAKNRSPLTGMSLGPTPSRRRIDPKTGAPMNAVTTAPENKTMNAINKQISALMNQFSSNPVSAAFLRKFSESVPIITQAFGNWNPELYSWGSHTGTDFGTKRGDAVVLPEGSWLIQEAYSGAGDGGVNDWTNNGYGNSVIAVNQQTGEKIRVSHLQDVAVKTGDTIPGGVIGSAGMSGHSTDVHTDVEYYDKDGNLSDVTGTDYVNKLFTDPTKVVAKSDKNAQVIKQNVTNIKKLPELAMKTQSKPQTLSATTQRQTVQTRPMTQSATVNRPQVQAVAQKPAIQSTYKAPQMSSPGMSSPARVSAPVVSKPAVSQPQVYKSTPAVYKSTPTPVSTPKPIQSKPVAKPQSGNIIQSVINSFARLFGR